MSRTIRRNAEVLAQANYYVDYIRARQQDLVPSELRNSRPELVVSVNGLEYVRLYRLKPKGESITYAPGQ